MKIIATDNFDRDTVNDELVAENVPDFYVSDIVEFLNEHFGGERAEKFFVAKPDDYKPYVWEP